MKPVASPSTDGGAPAAGPAFDATFAGLGWDDAPTKPLEMAGDAAGEVAVVRVVVDATVASTSCGEALRMPTILTMSTMVAATWLAAASTSEGGERPKPVAWRCVAATRLASVACARSRRASSWSFSAAVDEVPKKLARRAPSSWDTSSSILEADSTTARTAGMTSPLDEEWAAWTRSSMDAAKVV